MNRDCTQVTNLNVYFVEYDGANFQFTPSAGRLSIKGTLAYAGGVCTSTKTQSALGNLDARNGLVVVYGYDEQVGSLPPSRVKQVKYPYAALLETGAGVDYVSAANDAGCVKCHTDPYLKHGNIYAQVNGDAATDFYTCKACHLDDGEGGHFIWQLLVDNPQLIVDLENQYGEDWEESGDARLAPYAYKTTLMNDVHMSHAMEFPYPQSMANCATCHEGKLGAILTDANFTKETCKSCHAVTGPGSEKQAPALAAIWANANVAWHDIDGLACNTCHFEGGAKTFGEIHTGYDTKIYADAAGTKYSDAITVSIDNATLVGTDLTIDISASGAAGGLDSANITPAVMIGLYGYDTKDFIVNGHDRWDSNCNGTISRNDGDQPIGEYIVGDEVAGCPNPYWTLVSGAPGAGPWTITAHLANWAGMIDNGVIKRVEVAVMPELETDGELVPLNAVSRTVDLATGAFDDDFFGHEIVDVGNCNNCHDQLATTFHSGDRGGSITVCRMCHVTLAGGSHLEMQSRSIDSYVHAIHSFQPFDIGDINFADPVEAMHYEHHVGFPYPTHGITNCESCHNAGTYNVPDQSKSLPGVLSASDSPLDGRTRNIGAVPSYITGPASRACGSCHRAQMINEDAAGELASFNQHTRSFGYLVENGDVQEVIDDIMATFAP